MTAPAVTVPTVPPLARVPNVELMQTGTWNISTGTFTFTVEDLMASVAALGCPAVRRPVLKLGHVDPRFDGEPGVGYIDSMATADNGRTLVGDYAGMPGWLGEVLASAYPDRSIEGEYDYRCQMGHTHPFVVHAVALLGVTPPGIGSLESLQDVAQLYGVDVAAAAVPAATGTPVVVHAKGTPRMPNPTPRQVAASVSSTDVTRAFYDSELGRSWDIWIEELQLDPLQLIYINDADNTRYRVPVVVGAGDGVEAVTFGDPVKVVIRYEDAPAQPAAAARRDDVIRFASRAESRPGAPNTPAASAGGQSPSQEGSPAVAFTDEQLATMRQELGLEADADEAAISTALTERLAAPPEPAPTPSPEPVPTTLPEGVVTIDSAQLEALQVAARRGDEARARQEAEDRAATVDAAVGDGRIPPARREHWLSQLAADPGAAAVLASLTPGLIPVGAAIGHAGGNGGDSDPLYAAVFGNGKEGN